MNAPAALATTDLERFREVQQLAYRCAEEVASALAPGVTERQTAAKMKRWLTERGVDDWFHLPFAWFGDRTAFEGFRLPHQFFPTNRRIEEGMPYILDCAPIVDGYTADIGYSGSLGENAIVDRLRDDLAEHRELIVSEARAGKSLREIYDDVDQLIARQGYDNRHRKYPFGVIAHRVDLIDGWLPRVQVGRFGIRSLSWLLRDAGGGRKRGASPFWGPGRGSDHPPTPGLWAVEPHIGFRGVGAKFEELLVVTDSDVFWLDDDLPHVRRWQERGRTAAAKAPS